VSNFAQVGTEFACGELWMYTWYKGVHLKSNAQLVGTRTSAAVVVIAQQYSSATLVSLRIHSCKEKFDAPFKISLLIFLIA
jgi:hypothetical protein